MGEESFVVGQSKADTKEEKKNKQTCELLAHTWLPACVDQPRPCLGRLARLGLLILLPLPRGVSAADCLSLATCRLGQHSIDLCLEAVGELSPSLLLLLLLLLLVLLHWRGC